MSIDAEIGYQALRAHDARFDGRLFVGVTSTRIYCRPICRVRLPRRENCRFFETAAQAEAARFRPCMKCRPEIAPGPGLAWTAMDASRTLATQAAQALDAQAASVQVGDRRVAFFAVIGLWLKRHVATGQTRLHLQHLFALHVQSGGERVDFALCQS